MKTMLILCLIMPFVFVINSCKSNQKENLFNGKNLDNWILFVNSPDVNPDSVFHVSDKIIHVAGQPFGYMRSKKEYSNYKLHVEYRWGGTPANSGIFVHARGDDKVWPFCFECQLKNLNAGDIILMGVGTGITIKDSSYIVNPGDQPYKACSKFGESSENPPGEWNIVDIKCDHNDLEIIVNGVIQNQGTALSMTSGSICLQSEGGPVQFRNIYLEPLD